MAFSSTSYPQCMQACSPLGPPGTSSFFSMFRDDLLNMCVDIAVYNHGLDVVMRVIQLPSPATPTPCKCIIGMCNLPPLLTASLYQTTLLSLMAFSHLMTQLWLTLIFPNGALLARLSRTHIVSAVQQSVLQAPLSS
jgi:hypothetical protein